MLSYFEGAVPHKCMYIGKLWLEKDFYGDDYFVSGEDSLFSGFKIAGSDIFLHISEHMKTPYIFDVLFFFCIPVADFI